MAIICDDHGLLFIMAPRTACTAVGEEVLIPHLRGRYMPEADVVEGGVAIVSRKHNTLQELLDAGLLTPEHRQRLLVFTTVRNPFDSIVSLYLKQRERYSRLLDDPDSWVSRRPDYAAVVRLATEKPFPEWLQATKGLTALQRLRFRSGVPPHQRGVDAVMRFENLQDDLNGVLAKVGVDPVTIPQRNATVARAGRDYRTFYDKASRRLVERRFAYDIEAHGYTF